jgi:NADH-quinone oxidoreductase subunit L
MESTVAFVPQNLDELAALLLVVVVFTPAFAFIALTATWLVDIKLSERVVSMTAKLSSLLSVLALIGVTAGLAAHPEVSVTARLGAWFHVGHFHFPLLFFVDRLSLPLLIVTVVLVGLVTAFSSSYMHREQGYFRFFVQLLLFAFGANLIYASGNLDLLVAGWEFVGLTSMLLIAFFQHRKDPVKNGLRAFITYRICDLGLILGIVALHHYTGTSNFETVFERDAAWPLQHAAVGVGPSTLVGFLLLFAAIGKSAQVPLSGWLPRAMEGPTPSSALFYGAISVHAGAYLLLRASPLLDSEPYVPVAIIVVGALSAIHGTIVGRACTDAKTSIAYASMTQVGLIFVEIGLGLRFLALAHICGHAMLRTLQFLRAPSLLHDVHQTHAAMGSGHDDDNMLVLASPGLRDRIYRYAFERGGHDALLSRLVVRPLLTVSRGLHSVEDRASSALAFDREPQAPSPSPSGGER